MRRLHYPDKDNKLGIRFENIAEDKDTFEVEFLSHKVSDKVLYSEGYKNCNGVVLLNGKLAGLSHYDLRKERREYLEDMIDSISGFENLEKLKAILIAGNDLHFNENKKILEEYKINIIKEGLYGLQEKDVLVMPSTQEVIIYSALTGYKVLNKAKPL